MDKDAPAANQTVAAFSEPVRGTRRTRALVFGAVAGMVVGILNVMAIMDAWKVEYEFRYFDFPINSLITASDDLSGSIVRIGRDLYFHSQVTLICYWTLIGLLLASLFCLLRGGKIRRVVKCIARDRICRRALFAGVSGGLLIGALSCAADAYGWQKLEDWFEALNRPGTALMEAVWLRFNLIRFVRSDPLPLMIYVVLGTIIVYWSVLGFFVGFLFCLVRIARKRKGAAEN